MSEQPSSSSSEKFGSPTRDVEFQLFRTKYEGYQVGLRLPWRDTITEKLLPPPLEILREAVLNPTSSADYYGRQLGNWIIQGEIGAAYRKFLTSAAGSTPGRRLRIGFGPDVPEVVTLRWEALVDPQTKERLSLAPFS